jgi:hypothetical protein
MCLHPLTRLSTIRKELELGQEIPEDVALDLYWFTVDGKERLKEWRTLWDLDLVSGCTLYMRPSSTLLLSNVHCHSLQKYPGSCVISVTIRMDDSTSQIDVEEDETVGELKERCALLMGLSLIPRGITYRSKMLDNGKTLKDEGLVGGETLVCLPASSEDEIPRYDHAWNT